MDYLLFDLTYSEYLVIPEDKIVVALKSISNHLSKNQRIGKYESEELKKILENMYNFLLEGLEILILKYNSIDSF